jgi:hypothetical protein
MRRTLFRLALLVVALPLLGCGAAGGKVRIVATGMINVTAGRTVPTILHVYWDELDNKNKPAPARLKVKVQIEADQGLTVTPASFEVELDDRGYAEKWVSVAFDRTARGDLNFKATATPDWGTPTTMIKNFQVE